MDKHFAFLFDLDGVVINSEPQYSIFWKNIGEKYQLGVSNFDQLVKGSTFFDIITAYFSKISNEHQKKIKKEFQNFDMHLDIIATEGIIAFLSELQTNHFPIGLVTSSNIVKLDYVFQKLPIKSFFQTIVSANCVQFGKPHPMPYLKASETLQISPRHCFVFEDSRNGIKAGKAAGMPVIGLSTTLPADSIQCDCIKVIPNFLNFHLSDMQRFFNQV